MALRYSTAYLQLSVLLWLWVVVVKATSQALPNCPDKCGNISIHYPFGTTKECFRDPSFFVNCTAGDNLNDPGAVSKPFLGQNVELMNISIRDGELRVASFLAMDCYDALGQSDDKSNYSFDLPDIYTFSDKRNKFTVVGCDTIGYIEGFKGDTYDSGCISLCNDQTALTNDSCSGIGCCQTSIPKGLKNFKVTANSFYNHTRVLGFNPCSYAFLVEEESYRFSTLDLIDLRNKASVPLVLDWVIGNVTCTEAMKNLTDFACKQNSKCYDAYNTANTAGYRCSCLEGFQGNPYLQDGCQDVNECEDPKLHDCVHNCKNTNGSYVCPCKTGYHGDGKKNGTSCKQDNHAMVLVIKVAAGIAIAIVAGGGLYWVIRKRNIDKRREEYFKLNGGIILQQKLACKGSEETVQIFSIEELMKATNDFDDDRVIGKGGFGTVYKGVLPKNRIVAIKKSKVVDQVQSEQFANEFIVLSKINHINVVKLVGCCLETEVPLLVYEFITNGTLSRHIHEVGHASLPWGIRLRVASETAGALAYLHSAISPPIIHRDIKPSNILLDDNYSAKVSDFGDSRLIPAGQTQLDTLVKGTIGYLDPEYLQTGQLTEKSDVYNFGVVLVELLTGEKAVSLERSLVAYFISSLKQNRLFQILDVSVANEGSAEQIREVAKIAESCLRMKGDERPTMKEVAMELEGLRRVEQHNFIEFEMNLEETKRLVNESSMDFCSSSTTTEFDSLKNQGLAPFEMDGSRSIMYMWAVISFWLKSLLLNKACSTSPITWKKGKTVCSS